MSVGCSFPGCDRHPSKGDTILRISAKGTPFVGRCAEHYGPGGEENARAAENAAKAAISQPQGDPSQRSSSQPSTQDDGGAS